MDPRLPRMICLKVDDQTNETACSRKYAVLFRKSLVLVILFLLVALILNFISL